MQINNQESFWVIKPIYTLFIVGLIPITGLLKETAITHWVPIKILIPKSSQLSRTVKTHHKPSAPSQWTWLYTAFGIYLSARALFRQPQFPTPMNQEELIIV